MNQREEYVAFYFEIGLAITQWAMVEMVLLNLVQSCFSKRHQAATTSGYLSIDSFRAKLKFVDEVVRQRPRFKKHQATWKALQGRLSDLAAKRNQLAHRWVMTYTQSAPGRQKALVPWRSKGPRVPPDRSKPPNEALYLRDIVKVRYGFSAAFVSIENFQRQLLGKPAVLPASSERPMRVPELSAMRADLHRMLGYDVAATPATR